MRALAFVCVLAALGSADLAWNPVTGSSFRYRVTVTYETITNGMKHDIQIETVQRTKYVEVDADRVKAETATEELKVLVDGQVARTVDKEEASKTPASTTLSYRKTGDPLLDDVGSRKTFDELRMGALVKFYRPGKTVDTGETWTAESKPSRDGATVNVKRQYTLNSDERVSGRDCWKIDYIYTETGREPAMTAKGTYWIDKKNGEPLRLSATVRNFKMPNGPLMPEARLVVENL